MGGFTIADIAVIADIARDRGKTQSVEIVQLQKSLARATLTLAGMTLQAREKLQEDVEDGVLPLSRHTGRERQSSQSGARRPRNFFPLPRLLFFFTRNFQVFCKLRGFRILSTLTGTLASRILLRRLRTANER